MAAALLGCVLHVDAGGDCHVAARLVEVEAYLGPGDPASHAARGPTPRSAIMFEEPGHLYVYLSYGMHHCANVVTEAAGSAGAVLLRAAVVMVGEEIVRGRRGGVAGAQLLRGPGNLCRGLGIDRRDNGCDLCGRGTRMHIVSGEPVSVVASPRVGISRAQSHPLRFSIAGEPAVSVPLPRPGRPA